MCVQLLRDARKGGRVGEHGMRNRRLGWCVSAVGPAAASTRSHVEGLRQDLCYGCRGAQCLVCVLALCCVRVMFVALCCMCVSLVLCAGYMCSLELYACYVCSLFLYACYAMCVRILRVDFLHACRTKWSIKMFVSLP